MIADDGAPILMDFGSTIRARIAVENRSQALLQQVRVPQENLYERGLNFYQDIAAEQSTMAYRAPELYDVKTGITLDEKVDIWVRHAPLLQGLFFHSHSSSPLVAHSSRSPIPTHLSKKVHSRRSKGVR
jgi:serine/threonine kinase 16